MAVSSSSALLISFISAGTIGLVSQEERLVEQFVRQAGGSWLFTATAGPDGAVQLASIGCVLALSEVYDKVPLP